MQTNFGGKKDKSYIIREKKRSKKKYDFEKMCKPDPDFKDERKKK